MSELALPSAGKGEFPRLQESLVEVQHELDSASDGIAAVLTSAASEGDDEARLAAHARAVAILDAMKPRAIVFEKRAKEPDPDKRMYGPKMVQKVLDFCIALEAAVEHEEELSEALAPLRTRRAAAEAERVAQERAASEAAEAAAREAAATRAAAETAEASAAAAAEAEEARQRAAAIAAPLAGFGVTQAGEHEVEADGMGRRPLVAGLGLAEALELLQRTCRGAASSSESSTPPPSSAGAAVCPAELADALQALQGMCTNVIARPEEASFRTIRLLNASFQRALARWPGGVEALLAIGFSERDSLGDEEAIFYVMDEPSLEDDYEGWAAWYDGLKASQEALLAIMATLNVRPVPPASKGTGWDQVSATPKPPDMTDCLTLTREHGGAGP